jgi:hypothetical protein
MNRSTAEELAATLFDAMPCTLAPGNHPVGSTQLCVMEIVDAATDFQCTDRPSHAALPLARLAWNVNDSCPDLGVRDNGIATLAVGLRVAHTAPPAGARVPEEWLRDLVMNPAWGAVAQAANAMDSAGRPEQAAALRALPWDAQWPEVREVCRAAAAAVAEATTNDATANDAANAAANAADAADAAWAAPYPAPNPAPNAANAAAAALYAAAYAAAANAAAYAAAANAAANAAAARSKARWLARVDFTHHALDAWTARTGIDPDPVDVTAWTAHLAERLPLSVTVTP